MKYYLILLAGSLMCSLQFAFTKRYQRVSGQSMRSSMYFNLFSGLFSALLMLVCGKFSPDFSWFSLGFAVILSLDAILINYIGIRAMKLGKLSVYTLFMMLGGMLLPFLMGAAFLSEEISVPRIAAFAMIAAALALPVFEKKTEQKSSRLFYILCMLLFTLNGLYSCFNKLHQINLSAVDTTSYLLMVYLSEAVISSIVLLATSKKKTEPVVINKDSVLASIGFAFFSSVGSIGIVWSASYVDASVLYPIVTGGTIIFSAVCGRILFKEKLTKFVVAEAIIAVAATVLFMF